MATQTSNLGLTKPAYDEAADIVPAVNNNMDTLDSKIGAVPANSSVQGQLDSHTQAIATLSDQIANKTATYTLSNKATLVCGGIYRMSDLIIIQLRISITSEIANEGILTGLPRPKGNDGYNNMVYVSNSLSKRIYIDGLGAMVPSETIPTGTIILSAVYAI